MDPNFKIEETEEYQIMQQIEEVFKKPLLKTLHEKALLDVIYTFGEKRWHEGFDEGFKI